MVSCQYEIIYLFIYLIIYLLQAPSVIQLIYHQHLQTHVSQKKKKKQILGVALKMLTAKTVGVPEG